MTPSPEQHKAALDAAARAYELGGGSEGTVAAYLSALPEQTGELWQAIETAPKDGTRIWAHFPFVGEGNPVQWRRNHYEPKSNWTLDDGESATLTYDPPTHWMPLPKGPTCD